MKGQLNMDFLKDLFGDKQLSYDELVKAIEAHNKADEDNQIKVANLAGGEYISKEKYDAKEKELTKANEQLTTLNDTVKGFDGEKKDLDQKIKDLQKQYDTDTKALKEGFAKESAISQWFSQNKTNYTDLLKSKFDMEKITVDGDKVIGLDEQGKVLLEQYKDLFTPVVTGNDPINPPQGFKVTGFDNLVKNADNMSAEEVAAQFAELESK